MFFTSPSCSMITSSSLWAPSTTPTFSTSLPVPMWAPTPPPPWDLENYCEETIVEVELDPKPLIGSRF